MERNRQLCTFYVAGLLCGVDANKVQEIIRYQEMTHVPLAPAVIQGLINLRGQIVTAIDLRRRLELPVRPVDQSPMNVVVQTSDGAVSLLVDEIGDVQEVSADSFERAPDTLTGIVREMVYGVYKLRQGLLLHLDVERTAQVSAGA